MATYEVEEEVVGKKVDEAADARMPHLAEDIRLCRDDEGVLLVEFEARRHAAPAPRAYERLPRNAILRNDLGSEEFAVRPALDLEDEPGPADANLLDEGVLGVEERTERVVARRQRGETHRPRMKERRLATVNVRGSRCDCREKATARVAGRKGANSAQRAERNGKETKRSRSRQASKSARIQGQCM